MKKIYTILFIAASFVFLNSSSFAQSNSSSITVRAKVNNPSIPYGGNVDWVTDRIVSGTEPVGKQSGVYKTSNSTIYVSIPDTNIQSGAGIVILSSTNDGISWSNIGAIVPALIYSKTKMIRSGLDSIYCFFQEGSSIYCWNVLTSFVNQVRTGNYRDFDAAASSTGSMYVFADSLYSNQLSRYGSTDGGYTWGQRGNVSSGAAHPSVYMSGQGDTLVLNYYGPVLADTATSVIRSVRYRETAPGLLAVTGSFSNVASSSIPKTQFASVYYGRYIWFFYTSGTTGSMDLNCKVSSNSGVTFTDSVIIGSLPGRDESWFDAKHFSKGPGGVGVIYYSDSAQTGPPTNSSDNMNYTSASATGPKDFIPSVKFSEHPPVTSAANYYPVLIPYYNAAGDAGAVWVGADGVNNKVYFDKLASVLILAVNLEACSPMQDTITVTIRSTTAPYNIIESSKAYLSPTGTVQLILLNVGNNENYYIMVNHRNSIETWSKTGGEVFTAGVLNYNFTTSSAQAFGNNMVNVGGKWSFYSGDVNQDGIVDGGDLSLIDNDAFSFATGYLPTDLNCDSIVDGSDAAFADNNASNFVAVVRP